MKVCDRCGNPVKNNEYQMQQTVFPYYSIYINYFPTLCSGINIDLCEDCKKKIVNFIQNKEDLN